MNAEHQSILDKAKKRKYVGTTFLDTKGKPSTKESYLKQLEKRLQAEEAEEEKGVNDGA